MLPVWFRKVIQACWHLRQKEIYIHFCLFPPNRHYKLSVVLVCFFVPMFVPWYFWGESLRVAYFVPALLRYTLVLNATWLVNSAAHMWGNRPYDHGINPRENKFVTFSAIGMTQRKQAW